MLIGSRSFLVTGGAGFVGSWLLEALLERCPGARIAVLDNLFNGRTAHIPDAPNVVLIEADLRDGERVRDVVRAERPEVVIHLAALHYIPYCDAHPAETLAVNVVGTQNLLDACRTCPPRALVAASTVAVYPVRDEPNAEDSSTGPVDVYGLSKHTNEQQVALFAGQVDTRCAVARLSNVIGPRETNPHVVPAILEQVLCGSDTLHLGNVRPKRDYIDASDVAAGLIALADRNTASFRIYNLGTGREHSVAEIVAELAEVCGRPLTIEVDPARVRATDRLHLVCDMTRTREEIGWQARHNLRSSPETLWRASQVGEPAAATHG